VPVLKEIFKTNVRFVFSFFLLYAWLKILQNVRSSLLNFSHIGGNSFLGLLVEILQFLALKISDAQQGQSRYGSECLQLLEPIGNSNSISVAAWHNGLVCHGHGTVFSTAGIPNDVCHFIRSFLPEFEPLKFFSGFHKKTAISICFEFTHPEKNWRPDLIPEAFSNLGQCQKGFSSWQISGRQEIDNKNPLGSFRRNRSCW